MDAATAKALQAAVEAIRKKGNLPGLSVAVVFADGSEWSGQTGVGVLAPKAPLTADTLFSVGSITKTFTGALALRLAERGVIGLDDPLSKYLPDYPNGAKITLRELLDHTSGIADIFDPGPYKSIGANRSATWTAEKTLALIGKPYFAPGAGYHYSTTNYVILGQVLEAATGQTMAAMVRSEFLTPLRLSHTYLQWEESPEGTLAHGYLGPVGSPKDVSTGQSMLPFVSVATASGAGGGIASTASDLAAWGAALYGGELLDAASMAAMTDFSATARFKPHLPYGLALEKLTIGGHVAFGHRGHLDGFWSTLAYFPDTKITVALLTNADWPDPLRAMAIVYAALPAAP